MLNMGFDNQPGGCSVDTEQICKDTFTIYFNLK